MRDVPPPLRERALKLWNERFKNLIHTQQSPDGRIQDINRRNIERQFRDAVRGMEKEQSTPEAAQPQSGGTDPDQTSGRDTPAARRR